MKDEVSVQQQQIKNGVQVRNKEYQIEKLTKEKLEIMGLCISV